MTQTTATRVLLSGDEGTGTLAAVRGLHAGGYEVWLAVSRSDTYAARSRRLAGVLEVTDPGSDVERHAEELARAAARLGAHAVLPSTEGSLRAVTGREHLFPSATAIGTSLPEVLARATDKRLLNVLAGEAGLQAPPSFDLSDPDLDLEALPFPAIVKPLRSVDDAGRGLRVGEAERVSSPAELRRVLAPATDRDWLLQAYIEGTLAAVCGVAWRGELVCAVHQCSPRIWPPDCGISSYAYTTPANPEREAGVAALVRSIGWSGIFGVQFLLAGSHAYAIDFNPRVYGSLALAIAAGPNLPAIWADLLLGRAVTAEPYRAGFGYRVEEDDYRALLAAFRRGERAQALRGLWPRRRTVHGIFALTDPMPTVTSVQKLGRTLVSSRREARP